MNNRTLMAADSHQSAEWHLVDEPAREGTINEMVDRYVKQINEPNGLPIEVFMPLYEAIAAKLEKRKARRIRLGEVAHE